MAIDSNYASASVSNLLTGAAVRQLAEHCRASPDRLSEEDLRQYFLYLTNEKKFARASATIALCGIKFFYQHTLQQRWTTLELVRPAPEKKLPVMLSREEVRRILGAVRTPVYRTCLTTIYACGLRLLEGAQLQVADVDSARMVLHIPTAKATRTATCRCRHPRWRCCARSGAHIVRRSGWSRRPPARGWSTASRTMPVR